MCHGVCNEVRERVEPFPTTFDSEVEHVFKEHLQEELSLRFYAFLGVERVSFVAFDKDVEAGAVKRISVHLQAALSAQAPSQPGSSSLSPFATEFTPSGAAAASTTVDTSVHGVPFAAVTPDDSANHTSLLAVVIDDGAELGSTLLHVAEGPDVTNLLQPAEPSRLRVAASEQGEDVPSGDYEARLLVTNLLRPAEPSLLSFASSGQGEDVPSEDYEARLLAARARRRTEPRQRRSAPSQGPSEVLPLDDYERQLLASGIANPGGVEHLEWNRLWAYNHGEDF